MMAADGAPETGARRPSRPEAEAAIRTLIRWAGDDPSRQGLKDTPARVVRAFADWFSGYAADPVGLLQGGCTEIAGEGEMVVLRAIGFASHCEHHLAPISGEAHIAYLPGRRTIAAETLVRLVEVFARRLQSQETLTAEIANTLDAVLAPKGVAVRIEAVHHCIASRGVRQPGVSLVTSRLLGAFRNDPAQRRALLAVLAAPA